jgi:multiple sugar transport system substrate-binding protein
MAKDWSQDNMFWYNKKLFDQAGVKYPSETEPLSYDELLALGKKLTVRKGGKIQIYGLDAEWGFVMQGRIIQMLAQEGKSLWNHDYTEADFTSPEVRKILKWYIDWAQARIGPSPLDPEPSGWSGPPFHANRMAIAMYGYWFQGDIAADPHGLIKHVGFAPSPQWGSKRISACMTGTGAWIPQNAKNHQAAWKFMEYFMAGKPAYDRAISGWGNPSIKSLLPYMPHTTPYQRDFLRVQHNELKYLGILHYSPYVGHEAMETAIDKYMRPVMKGQMTLEQGAKQLQDAVNKLLRQGKQQVG